LSWISVKSKLPPDETPVLIWKSSTIQPGGEPRIGELRWERPAWDDTWQAYRYWDDPFDDGQPWEWHDVTHWMPLPEAP